MDPFTQRMLERAKSRREKLDSQKMILEQRCPLQQKVNLNEKTVSNNSGFADGTDNRKGKQYITAVRKSKLQRLAHFYSTSDENLFVEDNEFNEEENVPCDAERKSKFRLGKLNELAGKIKQWEDDLNNPVQHLSSSESNNKINENHDSKETAQNSKQTAWDSSMVEKLCSQGFSRSVSQTRLLYDFESKKGKDEKKKFVKNLNNKSSESVSAFNEKLTPRIENSIETRSEVLRKAAFLESAKRISSDKSTKDPAELSLAERKALFERNKDGIVLPQINFFSEQKSREKKSNSEKENQGSEFLIQTSIQKQTEEKKILFEENLHPKKESIPDKKETPELKTKNQSIPEPPTMPSCHPIGIVTSNCKEDEKKEAQLTSSKSGRLYPNLSNLDISNENEMSSFNESKNSNLCFNMTLSDLLELNKNNPTTPPSDRSFSQSKECQVLNKMDKLLEDALNDLSSSGTEEDPDDTVPRHSKMKKSSSFEYKNGLGNANSLLHTVSFYRKQQQNTCVAVENAKKIGGEIEEKKEDVDESVLVQEKIQTLIIEINKQLTIISQASQALNLCLSTVEFSGSGEQVEGERLLLLANHKRQACLNEVQRLKVENTLWPQGGSNFLTERGDVNLTNISIKLKRDALRSIAAENLQYFVCLVKSDEQVLATPVVSASKENLKDMALQFPGQIKLEDLLSNFKITVEIYNLELSKELLPHDIKYHIVNKKDKKLLTPIKSKKSESRLVKPNLQSPAGPNAVRTSDFKLCGYIVFSLREITRTQWILNKVPYVSPVEGTISMTIQSQLRLNDEFRGFLTMFDDICGFGAWHRRWCLLSSHFISYWKYPDDETKKAFLILKNELLPDGYNIIHSNLKIRKRLINMRVSVGNKKVGFFSREGYKFALGIAVPIGTIDLRCVITENIGLVSRDICARLYTFLLETTRPRLNGDRNSLVVSVKDDVTTIRHLLSADSRQEMTTWCKKLNTALALLRSWKCNSKE